MNPDSRSSKGVASQRVWNVVVVNTSEKVWARGLKPSPFSVCRKHGPKQLFIIKKRSPGSGRRGREARGEKRASETGCSPVDVRSDRKVLVELLEGGERHFWVEGVGGSFKDLRRHVDKHKGARSGAQSVKVLLAIETIRNGGREEAVLIQTLYIRR